MGTDLLFHSRCSLVLYCHCFCFSDVSLFCLVLYLKSQYQKRLSHNSGEGRHTKTVEVFLDHGGVPFDLKAADGRTCIEMTRNQGTIDLIMKRMAEKVDNPDL